MGEQAVVHKFMLNDKRIASELHAVSAESWKLAGYCTHTRNHGYDSGFIKWSNRPQILQPPSSRQATRAALSFRCSATWACHHSARLEETVLEGAVCRR